ncbi:MAG: four helix bundle protein [Saprospiraceae bacterium]
MKSFNLNAIIRAQKDLMHNFRNLRIWQDARLFAKKIYLTTKSFPKEENFGLSSQMKRAAVSIISNIAEGCGREGDKGVRQFLTYSLSSAFELEAQLLLSADLELIPEKEAAELVKELRGIQKGIYFFRQNLQ